MTEHATDPMAATRQTLAEMRADIPLIVWPTADHEGDCMGTLCEACGHCGHSLVNDCACRDRGCTCADYIPGDETRIARSYQTMLDVLDGAVGLAEEWGAAVGNTSTGPATLYVYEAHDRLRALLAGIGGAR